MRLGYVGVAVALTAALAGCASTAEEPDRSRPPRQPSIAEQQQAIGAPVVAGYEVSVSKIGLRSSLIELGLNGDGTVQVPPLSNVAQAGFYRDVKPGEVGPAAIYCHINGGGRDGCGARFDEMQPGDRIDVNTPQGPVAFEVYRVNSIDKARFPTAEVYSNVETPELRLITCGGNLDGTGANYLNNVIVWAKKI